MIDDEQIITTSPVIKKGSAKTSSFTEIIDDLIGGFRVTRLEWGSNDEYGYIKDEKLIIFTKGKEHIWWIQLSDMTANDWVVLPKLN